MSAPFALGYLFLGVALSSGQGPCRSSESILAGSESYIGERNGAVHARPRFVRLYCLTLQFSGSADVKTNRLRILLNLRSQKRQREYYLGEYSIQAEYEKNPDRGYS